MKSFYIKICPHCEIRVTSILVKDSNLWIN
jgi:hypothetical protein